MDTWTETSYETALWKIFSGNEKADLQHIWKQIKDFLIPNVLEEIKASEPNLTDHGPRHISNVLTNAYHLLHEQPRHSDRPLRSSKKFFPGLTNYDAYVLGVAIMYHDVGNIFGRHRHNQKIQQIFSETFTKYQLDTELRSLVASIAGVHTSGTNDSRSPIDSIVTVDERSMWKNHAICGRELAAILRFADELAEGPQRASMLRLRRDLPFSDPEPIDNKSRIYHQYAKFVTINIDRSNQRILVNLYLDLKELDDSRRKDNLVDIIDTFLTRLHKLNQERVYARYYTQLLTPCRQVSAGIQVYNGGAPLDFDVRPLVLDDLVIPQKLDNPPSFEGRDDFRTADLVDLISSISGVQL